MDQNLSPLIGEEPMDAWLSHHPTGELDAPATKEFVEAKAAELRGEMRVAFADVRTEMAQLRADLRSELHTEFDRMRNQLIAVGGALMGLLTLVVGLL